MTCGGKKLKVCIFNFFVWYALYCESTKQVAYLNFTLIILLLLNCPHRHTHKNVICGFIARVVTVILGFLFEGMGGVQCPSICLLYRQGIKWKGAWSSILWKSTRWWVEAVFPAHWDGGQTKEAWAGQSNSKLKYWTSQNSTIELAERGLSRAEPWEEEHTPPIFAHR